MKNWIFYLAVVLVLSACKSRSGQEEVLNDIRFDTVKTTYKSKVEKIIDHLKNPSDEYILVVSHRGDWRYAPENSYEAVKRCIDLGVDIVEIDVRKTKDGHMVLMHDKTVDRTTNGSGRVDELTLEEIKELRLKNACGVRGSMQEVPTLEEIMLLARDKIMVNLDKTEGKTLKEAYDVLKRTGTVHQAIFKGNDSVQFMREKYGNILDSVIYMPKVWYNTPQIEKFIEDYNNELQPVAYEVIFNDTASASFKAIEQLRQENICVLNIALWDALVAGHTDEKALLDGPDQAWGWLVDNGANAIMTDRPEELIQYLEENHLRTIK